MARSKSIRLQFLLLSTLAIAGYFCHRLSAIHCRLIIKIKGFKTMAKDTWDKLNIVVSNIILVAISIVIGFVGENISRSLERGKLIDSLLDDLTAPKTETS